MNDPNALSPSARQAFAQAYASGFALTARFLIAKGANFELAEEMAQLAWSRGWEALGQLRSADRTQSWVNSIAYHRLCSHRQRTSLSVKVPDLPVHREPALVAAMDARILLKGCTPVERTLLEQRYVAGMNLSEIADAHGLSEIAVRLRIHRCHQRLRTAASASVSLRRP